MRWLATILLYGLGGLSACSACSAESKLREGGPTPFTHCLAAAPPPARSGRIGDIAFELHDRVLTLTPRRWPLRVAAFSGAGFGSPARASGLARLRESGADLLLMLGGLGESEPIAQASAKALAALGQPMLLVLGGRDTWRISEAALEGLGDSSIINATTLRRISIANNTLVPVAGAEQGRYAVNEEACGFGRKDLEAAAKELGPTKGSERRWLISWQAPAAQGPLPSAARSEAGMELGSTSLGRFGERIGAIGALCAWPAGRQETSPDGPLTARLVPRLFGPLLERPDSSRVAPGFLLIELDDQGLRVVH
jgi:hypothetical protein